MISDIKWPILLIGNCILIFLTQLINHTLGLYTLHFCPFALFIFAPLILLPFTSGLISLVITGLILDASTNLLPGTTTIILLVVYTASFCFRRQFKTFSGWHNILILQSANAVIIAFLSVFTNPSNYGSPHYWASVFLNLIFSQILLILIASWFLNLQNSLLNLFSSKLKDPNSQTKVDNLSVEAS